MSRDRAHGTETGRGIAATVATQMADPIRGRFAPSPTGRMHLGNARSALLAWLQVRAAKGVIVMRIEDLDTGRCRPHFEEDLLDDLRWLGLDWDEGPHVGGPHGPYRQSQRGELYAEAAARLDTYPCTCTRREVREAALAPHGAEPIYPGTCRDAPTHRRRPAALRWRIPPGVVTVEDPLAGTLTQDMTTDVGDFVLRRTDGVWAYQLAVVVDDAAMQITDVLRGADLVTSTPRQVHLQRALGLPTPRHVHVPLVLGPDGEKLSKRQRVPDIGELRDAGTDPRTVVAGLAQSAGLLPADVEASTPAELVDAFVLADVSREPHRLGAIW
jgi:glutamyl-tRNA synthetase